MKIAAIVDTVSTLLPDIKAAIQRFQLNTGQRQLRYGLGCAWLGSDLANPRKVAEDRLTLDTAYQRGFRYFDTSAAYDESEVVVGQLVASIPRRSIFLATKSRLPNVGDAIRASEWVQRNLEASLRRLQTDHLDLFQLHDFQSLDEITADGVFEVLVEAKIQGLVRFVGVATRQHTLLRQSLDTGVIDSILTYGDYSIANQSAAGLIDYANARHAGVINGSPLLCLPRHKVNLSDPMILAAALQFPLTNPGIDITLTGPANSRQLESSLMALHQQIDASGWEQRNVIQLSS